MIVKSHGGVSPSVGNKNYMTMKKEYVKPEMNVIEFGMNTILCTSAPTDLPTGPDDEESLSRDDYYDNTPSRPGSGNIWDQGW